MPGAGRFAPAPTGALHAGHLLTAGLAWARARAAGDRFILRLEDLDAARSREEFVAPQLAVLKTAGLDWDEGWDLGGPHAPYRQSLRHARYAEALARLRESGRAYPCACSRAEVRASAPHAGEEGPVYAGTCRDLDPAEVLARCASLGREPAWRFRVAPGVVEFVDGARGPQRDEPSVSAGDFVLARGDQFAYQLAVVVDDAAMGITEVVRGGDLIGSTGRQLQLHAALGFTAPRFTHGPLLVNAEGQKLSKRDGALAASVLLDQWGADFWPEFAARLAPGLVPPTDHGLDALRSLAAHLPELPATITLSL